MRFALRFAIIVVIFSGHALAAKAKKSAAPKPPARTMDQNDPAAKELSEKRQATPKPETELERQRREEQSDVAEVARARARERTVLFGNAVVGFGKAPEALPGPVMESGTTTSVTFMAGGHYELSPTFSVAARLPWSVGSARQIDGTRSTVQALGALEVLGEYRVALSPFTQLPISFGLALPTAAGDYASASGIRQTQLNDVADAASGYRDPELFGPRRLPLIAGVGIDYQRKALRLHAGTKFVAGIKLAGKVEPATDVAGSYELKPLTLRNVTSAGIVYQLLAQPNLFGALESWLSYNAIDAVEFEPNQGSASHTRIQAVFEPRVGARFERISPSIGYIFPIGGRLADSSSSGLELHCDLAF